jgi:hypothetical protein
MHTRSSAADNYTMNKINAQSLEQSSLRRINSFISGLLRNSLYEHCPYSFIKKRLSSEDLFEHDHIR